MGELTSLPNIGLVLEKELNDIGITTVEQLRHSKAEEVFIHLKLQNPDACMHKLYSIAGAIEGIRYTALGEETKKQLRGFFRSLK